MNTQRPVFSLVSEPWIPVRRLNGSAEEVSLREIFENAHTISRISSELPTMDYALLRLILAIYWRSIIVDESSSEPWTTPKGWWDKGLLASMNGLPNLESTVAYLLNFSSSFELFNEKAPFMQVANLEKNDGQHDGIQRLLIHSESDYLALRAGGGLESLSFSEAARWLVHMQAWDYSGIKPGAVGDPRVTGGKGYPIGTGWCGNTGGVVLTGSSLSETILLNTVPERVFNESTMDEDLPSWERGPGLPSARTTEFPTGPIDLLTWQSRRVRLFASKDQVTGVLVTQGDRVTMKNQFEDPMTSYRYSKNQSTSTEDVFLPLQHDASRTLWRGVSALMTREGLISDQWTASSQKTTEIKLVSTVGWLADRSGPKTAIRERRIGVQLIGLTYGTQNAVVTNSIDEHLTLQLALLMERDASTSTLVRGVIQSTLDAAVEFGRFSGRVMQAAGADYAFQESAMESVLHQIDGDFRSWLATVSPERDHARMRNEWLTRVRESIFEHAQVLVLSASPKAVLGRSETSEGGKMHIISVPSAFYILQAQLNKILKLSEEVQEHVN